jgi:chromatin remodeling complex protein RSC6
MFMAKKKKSKVKAKAKVKAKKTTAKAKKAKPAKKATKKTARTMKTRKPNAAFMAPLTPSTSLGAVIGMNPLPRTEVTKKIWAYIKKNGLQDSTNRRMINADDKLRTVFGGKSQVSMFDMTKLISKHLS